MEQISLMVLRSIPLSKETRDAWYSANCHIIRRSKHNSRALLQSINAGNRRGLINLGNLDLDLSILNVPVFNSANSIRSISSPLALRRTLNDFIPPSSTTGPHWHKSGGFGGRGKAYHKEQVRECALLRGDVQKHIEGQEYRVITVGDVVVQAHRKEQLEGVGNFDWNWCGVDGVRTNGIIPTIKDAVTSIPDWQYTVFGWDVIVADRPYVIEINTSPGVNEATAKRIVDQIERILD